MASLIRSFHEDMSAELRINGQDMEGEIRVPNGLRQGCTIAPALFNMFFNLVVVTWRDQCMEGITILYKADGRLVGSRASKCDTAKLSELQFADDIAILAETNEKVVHAMSKLFEITSQWGLTISVPKTKALVVGGRDKEDHFLSDGDRQLEIVEEFKPCYMAQRHGQPKAYQPRSCRPSTIAVSEVSLPSHAFSSSQRESPHLKLGRCLGRERWLGKLYVEPNAVVGTQNLNIEYQKNPLWSTA